MSTPTVVRRWNALNPVVTDGGEHFSTRVLEHKYRETLKVAIALREWIDALPKGLELPCSMPGVDRDWVDETLDPKNQA
ncbi:MAG: hypothetical protein ACYSUV_02040 [Planctomycetota bacterium]|jgi:hypothetical protein